MSNALQTIFRKIFRDKNKPLNILTFPSYKEYDYLLGELGHTFLCIHSKKHHDNIEVPDNYVVIEVHGTSDVIVPGWIDLDLIISHNKEIDYDMGFFLCEALSIPLITVEHSYPKMTWAPNTLAIQNKRVGDITVYNSEDQMNAWNSQYTINNVVSPNDSNFKQKWQEIIEKALSI